MMTREELQNIFESEFSWENWKKVMNFVFPEFEFNIAKTNLPLDTKRKEDKLLSIIPHGQGRLTGGETLLLYEVVVKENIRLDKNVKSVRSFVSSDSIPNYQTIISVFHNADNTKWRFTLVVKEFTDENKIKDKKPGSYTYVFGVNEKGRTASDRFFKLAANQKKTLKDLEDAFSVEALSKKFFKEYKESYQKFVDDIIKNPPRLALFQENTKEKQEKCARDFVKKMMGRLVFLYFLQKKGWLGCKTKWHGGDEVFMKTFVDKAKKDDSFYFQFLEPLFFDTLNEKRTKQDEDCIISKINFGKVPYLNGGLFEKDDNHPTALTMTWENYRTFFETLNTYNFTIIEDDPDFKEVAVDPEMLGHIFENLLEDNKDKGAFYTPKEIVHYMCQESLYEYLKTYLQQNNHWPENETDQQQLEKSLQRFVKQKLASGVIDYDKPLAKALKDVKICDPAIGSGAFPMGLLNEIYNCVHKLHDESPDRVGDVWSIGKEWQGNKVKLNIIQNSIYGVDIEKGAVDIARLRFWLSLIVDEPEPTPLPNLEYKIVVGNSLISKLGDDVIVIDWSANDISHGLFGAELADKKKKILQEISDEQRESFNPDSDKHKLAADIRKLKIDLLITQLELMIKLANQDEQPKAASFKDKKAFTKATTNFILAEGWKEHIKQLQVLRQKKNDRLEFFDWKLDFPEVMNGQLADKPGFDILIGNPPYLNFKMYSASDKESYKKIYQQIFDGKADIYYYFFKRGEELLRDDGYLTFISSRYWLEAEFAVKLRTYISNNTSVKEIIDFKNVTIFDGIGIKTAITGFHKTKRELYSFHYRDHPGKKIDTINIDEFESLTIPKENILKNSWTLKGAAASSLIRKIESQSTRLEEIAYCKQGIVTGLDKAFITSEGAFDNLPIAYRKKWIKVGDIHKYAIIPVAKRELIYTNMIQRIEDHPDLEIRLRQFKNKLSGRREAANGKIRWFDLQWARDPKLFDSEKLICRFKATFNTFCYDADGCYSSADTTIVVLKDQHRLEFPLKYLLALLNSKLLDFYFKSYGKLMDYRFEYYPGPVGLLRVRKSDLKTKLISLVDDVLNAKQNNAETTALECLIDNYVYKIYELDYNEVKIVDPDFNLTEAEYDLI